MAETDWEAVAAGLERRCAAPTDEQSAIARALGFTLGLATPTPVAAAELRVRLHAPLELKIARDFGDEEYDTLLDLASRTNLTAPRRDELLNREVLNAWLRVARDRESAAALRRWRPGVADVVVARDRHKGPDVHGQIASISANGRLNFCGGYGLGTSPHRITRITRPGEADYAAQLALANEHLATIQKNPGQIIQAAKAQLDPWKITFPPIPAAIEALRDALERADRESVMQRVLEKHPALLGGAVVGNHATWVRPQVQLGNNYMADFMIAGYSSQGIRWVAVELESPLHRLTNPKNKRATSALRHAVDQIEDWRKWLTTNLSYARAAREADGLGLPGITAELPGLVIIGREDGDDPSADIRDLYRQRSHIQVRTYDWLMRLNEAADPLRPHAVDQPVRFT